ncbi:MAG: diacylglycerol kinase (ATP) [Flavobacteriales bacterium]|jgi:diacylglycerol kinase (ATP)
MSTPLAIVNPAAGGGRCGRRVGAALARLEAAGVSCDVETTRAPGDATTIARAAYRDGRRHFIAVGGDGTSYEIINGLFPEAHEAGERPKLGFLPLGTGNSFLRDFTTEGSAHSENALAEGRTRPCDVVRARHEGGAIFYINLLSIGFVADVNAFTNRHLKPLGEAGYSLGTVKEVVGLKPRPFQMALDNATPVREPLTFASFNNSKFTGGKMKIAPFADTADGRIDVVLVRALGRLQLLRAFPRIFKGTHVDMDEVTSDQVQRLSFRLDGPVDVMVDGEVERLHLKGLDVLHHALEVYA